jgi:HEAT repeat protein
MFKGLKTWKWSSALKAKGNAHEAYAAVLELGRLGTDEAVDLLIGSLSRLDGVARSAARELGRLGHSRALQPLADLLGQPEVNESAAEALIRVGAKAVDVLIEALRSESALARRTVARALGEIRDGRAVEPLAEVLQGDDDLAVRAAAANALGQIKDQRAIWALVNTLKLRDEVDPELQRQVVELRNAAQLAMRRIGDPLAAVKSGKDAAASASVEDVIGEIEGEAADISLHPRLLGELSLLSQNDIVGVLRELIAASEEISWAKLESREPVLAPYFRTYDQRRQTAESAGIELARRGGPDLLQTILERDLNSYTAIRNWWSHLELSSA